MALELPNLVEAHCTNLLVHFDLKLPSKLPEHLDRLLLAKDSDRPLRKAGYREFYARYTRDGRHHMIAGLLAIAGVKGFFRFSGALLCRPGSWRARKRVGVRPALQLVEYILLNATGRKRAARVQAQFSFPVDEFFSSILVPEPLVGDELALYSVGFRQRYSKTRHNSLGISVSDDAKTFFATTAFSLKIKPNAAFLSSTLAEARRTLLPVIEER